MFTEKVLRDVIEKDEIATVSINGVQYLISIAKPEYGYSYIDVAGKSYYSTETSFYKISDLYMEYVFKAVNFDMLAEIMDMFKGMGEDDEYDDVIKKYDSIAEKYVSGLNQVEEY